MTTTPTANESNKSDDQPGGAPTTRSASDQHGPANSVAAPANLPANDPGAQIQNAPSAHSTLLNSADTEVLLGVPGPGTRLGGRRKSTRRSPETTHNPDGTFRAGNPYAFQPGQSGNPRGRPKGVKAMTNRLRANMSTPFPGDPAGRNFGDVLMDNLALAAIRGDFRALLQVLDRLEGPPRARLEKDNSQDAELWTRIASQLLEECADNPDARRAILAAVDKIKIDEEEQ